MTAAHVMPTDEDTTPDLAALCESLREGSGFTHKRDIAEVLGSLNSSMPAANGAAALIGDDCAAIPDGEGHLLFAIEGFLDSFVQRKPWFAGWCGVMVNVSDIYAMGGRPIAVVDALWSPDAEHADAVMQGLAAASQRYGVPVVGGHSNRRTADGHLAVAIVGRAQRLLTSFDARPGDRLVMAIDLRGQYEEPDPFWNAATSAPGSRLRGDLELLPTLAEEGLCAAGKDISNAGPLGSALMLLECSRVGGTVSLDAIPRPEGVSLERWLRSFPSYGFVLSVPADKVADVLARFAERDIAAADVGGVVAGSGLQVQRGDESALLYDWQATPFIVPPVGLSSARDRLNRMIDGTGLRHD